MLKRLWEALKAWNRRMCRPGPMNPDDDFWEENGDGWLGP